MDQAVCMLINYIKLTREKLYEKVWSIPTRRLREELGISDVMIGKICKQNGIPKPPPGYWVRVRAGYQVRRTPLPETRKGQQEELYIRRRQRDNTRKVKVAAKATAVSILRITIREELDRSHPLIRATKSGLKGAKPNIYGLLEPPWNYEGLDLRVSPELLPRALRIMQTLIEGLGGLGYPVGVSNERQKRNTCVDVEGETVRFHLSESVRKIKRPPNAKISMSTVGSGATTTSLAVS